MIKPGEIATIGYEGSDIDDFVAVLEEMGVQVLCDVRELPSSRKKGFSKNALAAALSEVGIEYVHAKELGDPKAGRDAARAGKIDEFRSIFLNHMREEFAQRALNDLVEMAQEKRTCLMCFERDPKCCHRNIVVDQMLADHPFQVRHLGVPKGYSHRSA